MQQEHHINNNFPLLLLLMMSYFIFENYVDNPYSQMITGDKNNDRKYYQIIK